MSSTAPSSTGDRVADLRSAFFELLGAERRLRGRDQRDHGHGLTTAQMRALMVLRDGERSSGQIAERSFCTPASTTAMLDHLEAAGVIARRRSPDDRRVCLVSLTEQGCELVERKWEQSQAMWREHLAGIPASDLGAAASVIRTIAQMLDEQ